MPAPLAVSQVRDRRDHAAFVDLPYRLYRDDSNWVPPLRSQESDRWSPRRNPALAHRQWARWVVQRGGTVAGRIMAAYDPEFARRWQPGAGFFGFLECERDAAAAKALFDACHAWLRHVGAERVLGPVNLSTHEEVGLLVEGFDTPPSFLSPYNPPWYAELVAAADYRWLRGYYAYRWTPDDPGSVALQRLSRWRALAGTRIHVRQADLRRWAEECRVLHALYNAAFQDVWGFVPMEAREFEARARSFRPFLRPELALIAEAEGRPVGFALALPDINRVLPLARGHLLPFGWCRLARAIPRLRVARCLLLGVEPAFARRGVGPLLAKRLAEAGQRSGIEEGELSLVQEDNLPVRRVIEAIGARQSKAFALFGRDL